ncbi:MAG: DNA-directed RNA polymerase subunit beta', partial [Bacteroidota bacterium]
MHDPILLYIDGAAKPIHTTVGRIIFSQIVPNDLLFVDVQTGQQIPFINKEMRAKDLSRLVSRCFAELGNRRTVEFLDELKRLGFHYATVSGISIAIQDLIIPSHKQEFIKVAREKVEQIEKDYLSGGMSPGERHNKVIDVWHHLISQVEIALFEELEKGRDDEIEGFNPVHIMADSGARSKKESLRQISGMRGLMTKPSGEIIDKPIESCFREGLSVLEYFISTHGARKGLADTAIKTASSGYLTRKLVDVAQDVMITMSDCGSVNGITKTGGEGEDESLSEKIFGRTALENILDPNTGEIIAAQNELISPQAASRIEAVGITEVRVRSALACEAPHGACTKCY